MRDWLNGSTANAGNHWVEIQVWGQVGRAFVDEYLEWSGGENVQHYYAGSRWVALRAGGEVSFVLSDHLGSPSTLVGVGGELQASRRYTTWGETRMASGASGLGMGYTGQKQAVGLGGLYDYGARWFDPLLGRFLSPDTLVPDPYNPLDRDRYSYARNNPVRYTDPTGHKVIDGNSAGGLSLEDVLERSYKLNLKGKWSRRERFNLYSGVRSVVQWLEQGGGDLSTFTAYFEGTTIDHGHFPGKPLNSFVIGRSIRLSSGWDTSIFVHEMGHILDNTVGSHTASLFGGGPSDVFAVATGGNLCSPRFECSIGAGIAGFGKGLIGLGFSIGNNYSSGDSVELPNGWYGNLGPSEDFAESFKYSVLFPNDLKTYSQERYEWLQIFSSTLKEYVNWRP